MKNTLFALFLLFLTACEKPNPTPEVLDPIYSDLLKQAEGLKKAAAEQKNVVAGFQKDLGDAKPQTGQIFYARKRAQEATDKQTHLEQMAQYFEIRAESRKTFDRDEYSKAWNSKTPWPNPKEYESYKEAQKAQSTKINWSLKDRFVETGTPVPKSHGAQEPKAEVKKEGEAKE